MKYSVVLVCLLGFLGVASPAATPLDIVLLQVIADTDVNGDCEISVEEFQNELLIKWAGVGSETVTKDSFMKQWIAEYNEDPAITEQFFNNMDVFRDGRLTELDLLMLFPRLDKNLDGHITTTEFSMFMLDMHPHGGNVIVPYHGCGPTTPIAG